MTTLRQKTIREMDLKNLSIHTRRAYIAAVNGPAKHYQQSSDTSPSCVPGCRPDCFCTSAPRFSVT